MDVRHFAFLARQPSAALKPRDAFFGLPKRGLVLILANALFWQPLLAQAEGIVVSNPATSVGQAGNGVPVVNIATPNGSGLSHNQFKDYNVGPNGVILNNATGALQNTQLGGYIVGNPNLKGGAANVILNEVNGGSPSQLRGYTEVAGQSAKVIVANPYGITCSGCGFINTPNVTLTTGKPMMDNVGRLDHYQVDGGAVTIDGEGLNASNVDRFEIITRSAKINAQINARELAVVAGRNDVDAKSLKATARADDGSTKPELAIDSSALGGMYAGAIKLVGTEAGVGVKLDGTLAASGGDIQLDANGHLSMAQTAASGAVNINAASLDAKGPVYAGTALNVNTQGDLTNRQSLAARDRIALSSGGTLTNADIIEAGVNADNTRNATGDVSLRGKAVTNTGASVIASRALSVDAQALNNQGGTLGAKQHTQITAATVDNQNKGRILSNGGLAITADRLQNTQGGLVTSNGPLTAVVGEVHNQGGELSSLDTATLTVATLDNVAGLITAGNALSLNVGSLNNQAGLVTSQGTVSVAGNSLDNRQKGLVAGVGGVQVNVVNIDNRNGELSSRSGVVVTATQLDNSDGGLLIAGGGAGLNVDQLLNRNQGLISSEGLLSISARTLANGGGTLSSAGPLTLSALDAVDNRGGRLVTDGGLILNAASVDNSQNGTLSARQALSLGTADLNNQQGGQITSAEALTLDLHRGEFNNQNGLINAPLLMLNNLKNVHNQGGEISSSQAFTLTADNLDNSSGKLLSNAALTLRIGQALANVKGMIAAASVEAHATDLDNSGGTLTSRGDTLLNVAGRLTNRDQGLLNASNTLTLNSAALDNQNGSLLGSAIALEFGTATGDLNNTGGLITTAGNLTINHLRDLSNQGGELSSAQTLNLSGRTLNNSNGKLISNNLLVLNAENLINQNGLMSGWQGLTVSGANLDNRNSGTLSSRYGDLNATLTANLLNSAGGALVSQKALTVNAGELDNSNKGVLSSAAGQTLTVGGLLNNAQGGVIDSGAALSLATQNLDNSAGSISGGTATTLDLLATLTNTNGKLASGGPLLISRAAQINNQGGQIASQGLLTLLTGGLDNRNRGTLAANDRLSLTASGLVQNGNDGLIYSQNADLLLTANRLDNGKGTVQSQGGMTANVADTLDNQSGKLIAQAGDLSVNAGSLDNRGGTLASLKAALQTQVVGVLRNGYDLNNNRQGGVMQGQSLNLQAGSVDNYGGRIAAQGGNALVTTGNFDNRNGGLYAKGLMRVVGHDFDNSGDNDGQIAGQQIDLDLSGALNNRLGIIESESTLKVRAASLNNQTGRLRALGTAGTTEFAIGGLFDNRDGVVETANNDLTLNAGSFQNLGGNVLHVGTGNFGIAPANLNDVGGSLVTRGDLTITQGNWTNSSVIQAGQLTVNVDSLDQTATGQLLGARRFVGNGANWTTHGLIASDGALDLTLSGALNSTARISSLGNLNLNAAQASLSDTASIAGGGVTTANIAGTLNNRGRLTAATDLVVNAGTLNNYATLGSGQRLVATTGTLLNDHGLIFSGGDMSLRVDALNNSYADVYSLGNLSVDRDGKGGLASSILNSSSTIQSDGNLSLSANSIKNQRAVLDVNDAGVYTASATEGTCIEYVNAGDCHAGGTPRNYVWELVTRDKLEVTAASAGSSITSGGNMTLAGGDLLNSSSSIAAGGNFTARLNNLVNTGIETGETETYRLFTSTRTKHPGGWFSAAAALTNKYWYKSAGYNPNDLGGLEATVASFVGMMESERTQFGKVTKIASDDQRYAAVIQAGGAVDVKAQAGIDNSVVRLGYSYIGAGAKTTTDATGASGAAGYSTRVTLNQQLPPDLAQQQINPLSLPGFTLPTGQGGLFRLSGQSASAPASTGPQGWTLGGGSVDRTPVTGPVVPGSGTSADGVVINRVQGLPDSQFASNPQKYLIETNPLLTNLSQFLSSDYMLSKLGYDPDQAQKRLGDGLYEQRLIQQAVIARTGQRFIDGQTSDTAMFKYLMDNAIGTKQALNLAVGVSLTAEQVAALTHDIVWMENATVAGQQVLVPVLYLAQANNRLAPNGALITGSDLNLVSGTDLNNVGTLHATNNLAASAGRNMVNSGLVQAGNRLDLLAGNTLTNRAGGIIAGRDVSVRAVNGDVLNERTVTSHQSSSGYRTERTDFVDNAARIEAANTLTLQAGRDVNSTGGAFKSGADLGVQAGRDVNLATAEQRNANAVSTYMRSSSANQYGTVIEAGRDFQVVAARDISAIGSQLNATRDLALAAKGNVNLASAANEQHSAFNSKKVTSQEDHVQQVGTSLVAGENLSLSAGNDLVVSASRASAGKEAYLYAGNDLALNAAQDSDYSYYRKTKTSKGLLSSSQKTRIDSSNQISQQGSSISADTVVVRAGRDIGTTASDVVSTNATSLIAGRNVVIDGATETFEQSHSSSTKKSGLMSSGGIGVTLGSSSNQNTFTSSTETTRVSNIGSVLGSVDIQAGKDLTIRGSDVVAGKDISLVGQNVSILASENNNRSEQTSKSKTSGLTLALSGTVGSAVDSAYKTAKQAKNEDDGRLSALQGVKAGLTGVQAWQAAQQNGGMTGANASQFVGISISLGSQKSDSKQTQEQTLRQGSSLTAGNNLTILADGNGTPGAAGDIHVQGSKLQAGNEMRLAAERDIRLEAAANNQKLDGKNSSSGGAVGISLGVGSEGGGLSIFANANKGTGNEKGTGTTWAETTLDAGKQVSLISGRDTALKGAQVSADKITATVGRDLTLQSLQDTDNYKSKQTDVSGGVSFAIIGTGGSANLSISKSKIDSKYQSVQEQTGLFGGKGGYQIDVGNHTQLDGSVIGSTATADKNRLSTGTLGWSVLKNKAEYTSQLQSASVSSGSGSDGANAFISNMPSGSLIAFNHGDSDSGTTSSAISNGTLDIRDPAKQQQDVATLSHDVEHANGSISPIFDKEKEQKRLRQVQLIADIGTQASDIVRTQGAINAANAQKDPEAVAAARDKLIREGNTQPTEKEIAAQVTRTVMQPYGTGGDYQRAAQAVTAALQGLVGGDIGSALTGASAPYLANLIKQSTQGNDTARIMAHVVLGAVVAQAQGNSAVAGAAGAGTGELIAAQLYPDIKTENLSEEQRQTVSALSTLASGLAGGLAGGDLSGAIAGAKAGNNAVENNSMGDIGIALSEGKTLEQKAGEHVKAENERYKEQNCAGMSADACSAQMYAERRETLAYTVAGVGALAGAVLLGPALLNSCAMNPAVCTELSLTAVELPFGAATAGGTALGVGGFGSLAAKEVAATADAAAAARVAEGTKGLGSKVDDLLPNLNTRVLTETEARALGGENKGLIYVAEGPKGKPAAQDFQAGTNGAFTDLATGKGGVPALRYTNPNEKGVNFVKFDGIETAVDGSSVMLIDAKTKLAIWSPSTQKSVLDTLQRVKSAVDQNPGYKVVYEFPNQKVEAQAKAFIRSNGFDSIVSTRTRTP
ncbi:hemagglutinin repeat-containing protein [Pseudomonas fluorescens]|uniref:hemagglutinin repeat-containing protein n=1 Tax=Pseudomonas fluorescens TaxID=294 RepID=UPI0019076B70|nr:hemagglutinin repeat-containing protein [Pseudomonas fluorescens]MBD8093921.1 hemagglutinin repeat-containing protein [Pseudomonas fluorescens]MBD8716928.1 hemagglutinin repeat-containing protein [Pseudomonas fluorescens]